MRVLILFKTLLRKERPLNLTSFKAKPERETVFVNFYCASLNNWAVCKVHSRLFASGEICLDTTQPCKWFWIRTDLYHSPRALSYWTLWLRLVLIYSINRKVDIQLQTAIQQSILLCRFYLLLLFNYQAFNLLLAGSLPSLDQLFKSISKLLNWSDWTLKIWVSIKTIIKQNITNNGLLGLYSSKNQTFVCFQSLFFKRKTLLSFMFTRKRLASSLSWKCYSWYKTLRF